MNNGISIKKLLEGVEVEWKKLGEVVELKKGKQLNKKFLSENGKYPAYNGGVSYSGFTDKYNYEKDTIIISQGGASAGFVNFVTTKFYANAHCYVVLPNLSIVENRYVYHFLKLNQEKLMNKQHGAGIPALKTSEVLDIKIPIPPLPIQSEIVRILDNFTELTAELTAELTDRKKQYEYYRNKLLIFKDGEVEWKKLGEVVKIKNGKDWKKLGEGNIPVYGSGGIMGFVDSPSYTKVSVLIPRKGTITNIFYVEEPFWNVDTIFYTIINENMIIPKYFYYFMSNFDLTNLSTDSTRPSLTQTILNKIKIPIPSLEEQQKIVNILDKFDTLTNSISEGLPKEIELRTKQYEYYRDLLLTFPKKD
jgi:type I restriction enzyme S subunit